MPPPGEMRTGPVASGTGSSDQAASEINLQPNAADRRRRAVDLDQRIDRALGDAFELLAECFRTGAWLDLGHASWDAYLATKGDVARRRIPAGERAEVFGRFRDAGMSYRQIAAATGVSDMTVGRSFTATNVAHDDLDQDDDVLTEDEWQESDEPRPDIDIMTNYPEIARQIEDLKASRFAANVRRVFYSIASAEARFSIERIAEVARTNGEFEATLRDDIAESTRWFTQVLAALAANPSNVRTIRIVK